MLVIPLSLDGTHAYGFIGHIQSVRLPPIFDASFFSEVVGRRYPREVVGHLWVQLESAGSWRHAEGLMKPIVPLFAIFRQTEIDKFMTVCIANDQIYSASLCRSTYILAFINAHRARIDPTQLVVLEYQVEHEQPYPGP